MAGLRPPAGGVWVAARGAREQLGRVERLLPVSERPCTLVPRLAPVADLSRAVPPHALQADRRTEDVASEALHAGAILRLDPNPGMNREAGVAPRQQ